MSQRICIYDHTLEEITLFELEGKNTKSPINISCFYAVTHQKKTSTSTVGHDAWLHDQGNQVDQDIQAQTTCLQTGMHAHMYSEFVFHACEQLDSHKIFHIEHDLQKEKNARAAWN